MKATIAFVIVPSGATVEQEIEAVNTTLKNVDLAILEKEDSGDPEEPWPYCRLFVRGIVLSAALEKLVGRIDPDGSKIYGVRTFHIFDDMAKEKLLQQLKDAFVGDELKLFTLPSVAPVWYGGASAL